jgi:hypothetical protein
MTVSGNVVKADQRLERATVGATEALAEHRWHWTLDESNPKRVPINAYAKAVSRNEKSIRAMVKGYAVWSSGPGARSLAEEIERTKMGVEKAAVTSAVAKARGVEFKTASEKRGDEVRRVRAIAQDRAEKRGTTVEEEAEKVAETAARIERAAQKQQETRRKGHGLAFLSVDNELTKIVRKLSKVLQETEGVEFSAEERELLSDAISKVKAVLDLIDMRLTGAADIDWDAELAKLAE